MGGNRIGDSTLHYGAYRPAQSHLIRHARKELRGRFLGVLSLRPQGRKSSREERLVKSARFPGGHILQQSLGIIGNAG